MQISSKTGVVQVIVVLRSRPSEKNNRAKEHGTASVVAADDCENVSHEKFEKFNGREQIRSSRETGR